MLQIPGYWRFVPDDSHQLPGRGLHRGFHRVRWGDGYMGLPGGGVHGCAHYRGLEGDCAAVRGAVELPSLLRCHRWEACCSEGPCELRSSSTTREHFPLFSWQLSTQTSASASSMWGAMGEPVMEEFWPTRCLVRPSELAISSSLLTEYCQRLRREDPCLMCL